MITLKSVHMGAIVLAITIALLMVYSLLAVEAHGAVKAINPETVQHYAVGGEGAAASLSEQVTCPTEMIAYWRFNESTGTSFVDSIQGLDATCIGAACPAFVSGRVNGALGFDITAGTQVTAPHHSDFEWLNGDSFSLELWVKPEACNDDVFFGKYSTTASWWLGCEAEGDIAAFSLRDTELENGVRIVGTESIVDGNWHHIVSLRDAIANENRLYIDGELAASETVNYAGDFSNGEKLTFGYHDDKYFATATIDEVAAYSKVLTADEIAKHYDEGVAGRDYCNTHPIAENGSYVTSIGASVSVSLVYSDPDGPGPYVEQIVSGPKHGTLSGSGFNRTYTPEAGYEGSDSFTWRISDGLDHSNVADVTIVVLDVGNFLYLPFVAGR